MRESSSSRGGTKRKRKREAGQRRGCQGWASWEGWAPRRAPRSPAAPGRPGRKGRGHGAHPGQGGMVPLCNFLKALFLKAPELKHGHMDCVRRHFYRRWRDSRDAHCNLRFLRCTQGPLVREQPAPLSVAGLVGRVRQGSVPPAWTPGRRQEGFWLLWPLDCWRGWSGLSGEEGERSEGGRGT